MGGGKKARLQKKLKSTGLNYENALANSEADEPSKNQGRAREKIRLEGKGGIESKRMQA